MEVLHVGCEPGSTVTGQTCLNELYEQTTCTTTAPVLRPSVPTDSATLQRPERRERLARSVYITTSCVGDSTFWSSARERQRRLPPDLFYFLS